MGPTRSWTGRDATTLRKALRMTTDGFAARLQVAPRTVANWAANPEMVPRLGAQDELDRLLAAAPAEVQAHLDGAAFATGGEAAQVLRVAIAILAHDGQVLLVRRRDDGAGISWQFPAGIIKPGERGEDVAVRETLAETGVHCSVKEHLGSRRHPVTGVQCDYYRCEYLAGDAHNRDSVENAGVTWAPQTQLTKFVSRETVYPPVLRMLEDTHAA